MIGNHLYKLLIGALACALIVVSCERTWMRNDLEAIQARGELVLITRNNFACYYEAAHGPAGFEYHLAKAFAEHIGVSLRTVVIEEEAGMIEALLAGKADLIAGGFPFGRASARLVALGPGYLEVRKQVVGRRGGPVITHAKDLAQHPLWIIGSSAGLDELNLLKTAHPDLSWQIASQVGSEEMLQMVWNSSVPLTVVESNTLILNRRFYPELVTHMDLGEPQQLRWAMNPKSRHLQRAVQQWFAAKSTKDSLSSLLKYYYSHLEDFDYVDMARYRRRIAERLPKYQIHFEEAAQNHGLDWRLVAAMAYQESHWNPNAQSFTGVRGIMMLTQDTAKFLGLKDRKAEKESIFAGTRYLAHLHRMIGDEVPEPDRTLMALAAYNIGLGHLQDARILARSQGKSGAAWSDVREILPLLQKKKYYQNLIYGYARGNEAVQYVDRIRTYHKVLTGASATENARVGG
jgi:membrane-bound lytic murein transglycosylase F